MADKNIEVTDAREGGGGSRPRGRPRQITRPDIVSAARGVPPEALTMQAVADVLGVDPKALNYHVGDRDGLRALVALDVFESELRAVALPDDGDWRLIVRLYARALHDAVVKLGVLAFYFRLPESGLGALAPVERVLQALVDAGCSIAQAGDSLQLISELGHAAGRSQVIVARARVHPNVREIESVLTTADPNAFPILRQMVAEGYSAGAVDDEARRLDFYLDVVIAGIEKVLASA